MARRPPPHHAAPRSRTRRRNQRRLSCRRLGRRRLSTPPSTHSSAPNGKRQLKSRQSAPLERMTRTIHNSVQASLSHPFFPYRICHTPNSLSHPFFPYVTHPVSHTHSSHMPHTQFSLTPFFPHVTHTHLTTIIVRIYHPIHCVDSVQLSPRASQSKRRGRLTRRRVSHHNHYLCLFQMSPPHFCHMSNI